MQTYCIYIQIRGNLQVDERRLNNELRQPAIGSSQRGAHRLIARKRGDEEQPCCRTPVAYMSEQEANQSADDTIVT
jgi:hypothetical protein